ncbi:MAG TPA: ribulose-phosphate 3-epimerase [Victivallales bacterium]|nr:ribulose-phosphate 3-epimerase [Victivallales bacterium]
MTQIRNDISKLPTGEILVAPSILAANFAKLGEELGLVESAGADMIHVDVMDGHFVPNITIGPPVVTSLRKYSKLPFDVHLMITNPLKYARPFAEAGADHITFHTECSDNIEEVFNEIKSCGCTAGLCVKPKTQAKEIFKWIDKTAMILVMTVEPGFGGQKFMRDMMTKVREIRDYIDKNKLHVHLEVDGGIDAETVKEAAAAGANVMVAGTSVFRSPLGYKKAIDQIKKR